MTDSPKGNRVKPLPPENDCMDCGVKATGTSNPNYYSVHDDVWARAIGEEDGPGLLCLGCLSARLNRPLETRDFTSAPINFMNGPLG